MKDTQDNLTGALQEFFFLLKKYPDDVRYVSEFRNFLRNFLRINSGRDSLPTMEVTTILKNDKPIIFKVMQESKENWLHILTHAVMDIHEARSRIATIFDKDEVR
ncbi:hypothetical protein PP175_04285 [Aneurinibacillus sp. Ricciae_BoGa-3]|uniref:hypothetical protein n=1 Tax=Aneurinibacillus sp. Ricciae_BoGa-3 TaxID=3022697 RepID=UPI0023415A1B|nr:hypothetical protein [Aneurinibacillus sp. Ricciae_BoGa-3]WCK55212.1 hypothetical protein PP175_04285 [Aneurinibacillus sp. Ricciae_BoGa-3]